MFQANYEYNFYKNNLREAEYQRKQNELIRIAEGGSQQTAFLPHLMRTIAARTQPKQVTADVCRAPAL